MFPFVPVQEKHALRRAFGRCLQVVELRLAVGAIANRLLCYSDLDDARDDWWKLPFGEEVARQQNRFGAALGVEPVS